MRKQIIFEHMKAVISGATRGVGRAITEQLAKENFELILIARNKKALDELIDLLESSGVKVHGLALDLSKQQSFQQLSNKASLLNGVTTIVNNLGVYSTQSAENISIDQLQHQLEVNLYSAIQLTQTLLDDSLPQCVNTIINIGSVMSIHASPHAADYSISKHAFKGWNDSLRERLRAKEIKVSAIYPGSINTSSWDGIDAPRDEMIQADDIAKAISYLLSLSKNALVEEIHISPQNFNS